MADAERTEILKWLSKVEYAKHHLNASEGRVEGTGEWLFGKKKFLDWRKSSASTILWLRGIRKILTIPKIYAGALKLEKRGTSQA